MKVGDAVLVRGDHPWFGETGKIVGLAPHDRGVDWLVKLDHVPYTVVAAKRDLKPMREAAS